MVKRFMETMAEVIKARAAATASMAGKSKTKGRRPWKPTKKSAKRKAQTK